MATNTRTLPDEDGAYSDWIELYNPDATAVNLDGWFLTDTAAAKTKWRIPAVTIAPGGYLVVFASNKDRAQPAGLLHTNFALRSGGEYLGLIRPDGASVASEFAPAFPALGDDVSYGIVRPSPGLPGVLAILAHPTPGSANSPAGDALTESVTFSRAAGPFRGSFSLQLFGAGSNQKIRYVSAPSASAATLPEPSATSPEYSAALTIDQSTLVRAAVFSSDGLRHGPVVTAYYARLGATVTGFTSQLPVLVIDSLGSGPLVKDSVDHAGWLYSYPARGGASPTFTSSPELISPLETTVRGSSSAEFPKKGYNLKFRDASGASAAQPLLDLPAYEKWALIAPWEFDLSYLNNSFIYSLSTQMGRWAPRTRLVELFVNANGGDIDSGDYAGIYVVSDRIEPGEGRVEIETMEPKDTSGSAVTGGYIFKIDVQDPDEIGWQTSRSYPENHNSSIVLVAPKADEVAPAQVSYLRDFVQRMENALFADQAAGFAQRTYLDYIDRDSWVDHHILNTFACNPDAFVRSAYFTKDRNQRIKAGPLWDFDRALGSYWDERSFRWDVWSGVGGPDFWRTGWWGVLARDPEFMQDWIDRWQSLRRAELSNPGLISLVETLGAQVGEAAASRDAKRWPDNASPYGSYAAMVDHLKGWATLRAQWIDGQFLAGPQVTVAGGTVTFIAPAGAQLAYTTDGSDPRALGGDIAPNATLTASTLALPVTANAHVRSYKAELRGTFPGSPWSSAVGTEASSPLTPRARLVNLSSRAVVGSGENALIAGVVIADTEGKRYLSRAVGPGLAAFGAAGTIADPQLSIFSGTSVELFRNSGWENGRNAALIPSYSRTVGAFPLPAGSKDSVLAEEVTAGAYTLQVTSPSSQSGIGLAELYELDGNGRTVNLSTRARVRSGDGVLIGGFVVQGPAYKRMLIRAVGPTLGTFGLSNALADPVMTVYSGAAIVASNDRWQSEANAAAIAAAAKSAGAFALVANSQDAALLITLPPGAYTVEVKGKADSEGVALLEIYEVP